MKDLIGKAKMNKSSLATIPQRIRVKKLTYLTKKKYRQNLIESCVGPMLAKQILESKNTFESYLVKTCATMQHKSVSINELSDAFVCLKLNKSPGYDEISFNVVKKCSSELCKPRKYVFNLFNLSIETGVFQDKLKIARVSPVCKAGDIGGLITYRPISVLPCFSKIFDRIMHNHPFSYVSQEKVLHSKQFSFQSSHSTEHSILQ